MKIKLIILTCIISLGISFAQQTEKFKPSKIITITVVNVDNFSQVECSEDFEYHFEKGSKPQVKFETHENMHDLLKANNESGTLKFSFLEKPKVFKKLKITIFYNDDLSQITTKGDAAIYAVERLKLKKLTLNAADKSKLYVNGDIENFELNMDHKSKGELNINSDQAKVICSQNTSLIAMFTAKTAQFDAYQNSSITLEGETEQAKIRTSNSASFVGKKFNTSQAEIFAELNSSIGVFCNDKILINASGNSEILLYGTAKIEMVKFDGDAKLQKKSKL
jgi:hypothetical protein